MRRLFVSAIALLSIFQIVDLKAEGVSIASNSSVENQDSNVVKDVKVSKDKGEKKLKKKKDKKKKTDETQNREVEDKSSKKTEGFLPRIASEDFLGNANSVASTINLNQIAMTPVATQSGWVIPLHFTPELAQAIVDRDGSGFTKILLRNEYHEPNLIGCVRTAARDAIQNVSDNTIEIIKKLRIVEHETFRTWLEKKEMAEIFASKIDDNQTRSTSFVAIPLRYDNDSRKISVDFSAVSEVIKEKLEIAERIMTAEKTIDERRQERKLKISPEMQLALDELRSLEEQNKVITKQLEDEKARVTGDISGSKSEAESLALEKATKESEKAAAEKAKTDAETAKSKAEKAKQDAENEIKSMKTKLSEAESKLKSAQNSLNKSKPELSKVQGNRTAKQKRLNNLKAKGRISTNELNAMKKETGNRRLKKPQAITQIQTEINTLSKSITDLNKKVDTAQADIKKFNLQKADLNKKNAAAESKKKTAGANIASSEKTISEQVAKISDLENQIADINNRAEAAKSKASNLQKGIDSIELSKKANEARIKELESNPDVKKAMGNAMYLDQAIEDQVSIINSEFLKALNA